ncbi:hypothetical protein KAW64_08965, partial [bacterium]|nr:hypothetical protein [bacterium]
YVTGHPLARFGRELDAFATASIENLPEIDDGEEVRLGGIITGVKTTNDRKGQRMAFVTIEDFTGTVETIVFSGTYAKRQAEIRNEAAVIIDGKVSTREEQEPKIIVNDLVPLSSAMGRFVERIAIHLTTVGLEESLLHDVRDVLLKHPGRCPVEIVLETADRRELTVGVGTVRVEPCPALLDGLEPLVGQSSVELVGAARRAGVPEPRF